MCFKLLQHSVVFATAVNHFKAKLKDNEPLLCVGLLKADF